MNEGWIAFYIILGIFSIGYGIFLIALHIRLWQVLGYIRMGCEVLLSQNEYVKKLAIEKYKRGERDINQIADQLKVMPRAVRAWIEDDPEIQTERAEKKRRAIQIYKEGNNDLYEIAKQVSANYESVEKWIKSDPEIQADKKRRAIEMHKEGKDNYSIVKKIGAPYNEVEGWIESDQVNEVKEPPDEQ